MHTYVHTLEHTQLSVHTYTCTHAYTLEYTRAHTHAQPHLSFPRPINAMFPALGHEWHEADWRGHPFLRQCPGHVVPGGRDRFDQAPVFSVPWLGAEVGRVVPISLCLLPSFSNSD